MSPKVTQNAAKLKKSVKDKEARLRALQPV